VTATDTILGVQLGAGADIVINLDSTAFVTGQSLIIKDENGLCNNVPAPVGQKIDVQDGGGATIDGAAVQQLETEYAAMELYLNGAGDWSVVTMDQQEDSVMGGTSIPGTAGNNAASALLDISALTGQKCVIATEGPIKVRFGLVAVTTATFDFFIPPGTSDPFVVGAAITRLSAWGEGGAWKFNLVPVE
jgi:hypothetical protein